MTRPRTSFVRSSCQWSLLAIATIVTIDRGGALLAQATQDPQGPAFHARADVIQLDATVLDKNGKPVRGLTAADFTVRENGVGRPIIGVSEVTIPGADPTDAGWRREAPHELTTNRPREGRLIVIILDDATIGNVYLVAHAKDAADRVVDHLGPNDMAAVLLTLDSAQSQDFTTDHAKLKAAIERLHVGFDAPGQTMYQAFAYRALEQTTIYLESVPSRRKVVVFVSGSEPPDDVSRDWMRPDDVLLGARSTSATPAGLGAIGPAPDLNMLIDANRALPAGFLESAMLANVTVFPIDPAGLRGSGDIGLPPGALQDVSSRVLDYLSTIAGLTGGKAIVNTNDLAPGIDKIFDETSDYYLVGYQTARPPNDGHFRLVDVKVNRPGLTVGSRRVFFSAVPKPPARSTVPLDPRLVALDTAIATLLPRADLPMAVTTAPFWTGVGTKETIALIENIRVPAERTTAPSEDFDLQTRVFTIEGKELTSTEQAARLTLVPGQDGEYEALSRVDLKPGRYEVRLSTHAMTTNRLASVYADVTVPDFSKATLSLSGVVLGVTPPPVAGPKDAFTELLPFVPTARRSFAVTDAVTAFARVYQSKDPVQLATVRLEITDAHNAVVSQEDRPLDAAAFTGRKPATAEMTCALPIKTLAPGPYLLSVSVVAGTRKDTLRARQDVRFSVR